MKVVPGLDKSAVHSDLGDAVRRRHWLDNVVPSLLRQVFLVREVSLLIVAALQSEIVCPTAGQRHRRLLTASWPHSSQECQVFPWVKRRRSDSARHATSVFLIRDTVTTNCPHLRKLSRCRSTERSAIIGNRGTHGI